MSTDRLYFFKSLDYIGNTGRKQRGTRRGRSLPFGFSRFFSTPLSAPRAHASPTSARNEACFRPAAARSTSLPLSVFSSFGHGWRQRSHASDRWLAYSGLFSPVLLLLSRVLSGAGTRGCLLMKERPKSHPGNEPSANVFLSWSTLDRDRNSAFIDLIRIEWVRTWPPIY